MRRFCLFFTGLPLLLASAARADTPMTVSAINVVVADSVITYAEIEDGMLQSETAQAVARLYATDKQEYAKAIVKLKDQAIEQMVEDKLILHEFITSGYVTNVLESLIDDQIREEVQKNYHGDRALLIQTLHARGKTLDAHRREVRDGFIIRYMKYQNDSELHKIFISPLKIEQYYEAHQDSFKMKDQVDLRMIVIEQPSSRPAGFASEMAGEVLAKINAGASFDQMARIYSSGSQRAAGGKRGWVDRTDCRPELSDVAFSLKAGQHSGVIKLPETSEMPETCYILQVDDARPAHVKPVAEVRQEIEVALKTQESKRLYERWIHRLQKKTFVWYYQ